MAFKDLTDVERRVYEYVRDHDFANYPWSTRHAARDLKTNEEEVYTALSELTKKIRDNIWIYYDKGELHIVAD